MHIDKRAPLGVSLSIAVGLCLAQAAAAGDSDFSTTINGYGTIGGTFTGNSGYTYVQDANSTKATNSQFDLGLDSRIGVQANFSYGTDLSIIVQEEAKRRSADNFSLGTEWAFFQYTPVSDLKLRLGRVALATFLTSDSRDVGYAQPWFHAPNEVYGAEPFETLDGGQALWHTNLGPVGLDLEGQYGTTGQSAKSAYNAAVALTYGNMLFRVAETTVEVPLTLPLGPTPISYQLKDKFLSVGFQYDNSKAIVMSEWAKRSQNDIPVINEPINSATQWYVAGGWRLGKLTPLIIYGKWDGNAALDNPAKSDATWSESLRYDIVQNVALKAQFSRPQVSNTQYWVTPNYASSERVNVFSLGADFVF